MIDGMLGMAYGVSATSMLLAMGIAPAAASATVHAAEIVTTALSGASHLTVGNISKILVRRLIIPGVVGAVAGAYILVSVPGHLIRPWVAAYLLVMGVVILLKARRRIPHREVHTHLVPLGLAGGFFDAVGGGGWGPIVTGTLVARGHDPRFTVGSVNLAEFFVTVSASVTFILTIGLSNWPAIIGLALGGALAAPLAALATKRVSPRPLMVIVGVAVIALSVRTLLLAVRG
jgi:uncharacterized membrane protein YfcA